MSGNEVEVKFRVADIEALRGKLREAGFKEVTPRTHEMNTLYDLPDRSLRSRGEVLRIRKYGDSWKLTHKSKGLAGKHKSREERETTITDGATMDGIFRTLGFEPTFQYEKFRSEWSDGTGHVVVDETPIGNLAEIEGPAEWIDATARRMGVSERDYITKSYIELFFEWKTKTGSAAGGMTFEECAPGKS